MPQLSRPDARFRASFLAAMQEFRVEGRAGDDSLMGADLERWTGTWESAAGFASYVEDVLGTSHRPPQPGWVLATTWWWTEDEEYLGRVNLRHELTEHLREVGGHIGYDVRRSRRREGHATAMLAAALPEARALGLERVLITCDHDNLGSRRVIEANGGVLEDQRGAKLRYWVATGA